MGWKREEGKKKFRLEVKKAMKKNREWKVIKWKRKREKGVNMEIKMEKWTEYFKGLSGGIEIMIRGKGGKRGKGLEQIKRSLEVY